MIEVKYDKKQLRKIKRAFNKLKHMLAGESEVVKAMQLWALLVEDSAKRLVNVNTGALRGRINNFIFEQSLNILTMKVSTRSKTWKPSASDIPYEWFLEYGTEPHWVSPVNKKSLKWVESSGQIRFSKGHMVSGIRATMFMQRAYLANKDKGQALLMKAMRQEIKKAKR